MGSKARLDKLAGGWKNNLPKFNTPNHCANQNKVILADFGRGTQSLASKEGANHPSGKLSVLAVARRHLGMSLSLTKFEYSNIVEFSLITQTQTPEIDLLNERFDMV